MPIHPTLEAVAQAMYDNPAYHPTHEQTPEEARRSYELFTTAFGPGEEVGAVEDRLLPGPVCELPIRVYRPAAEGKPGPLPALVYFHGGGLVVGNLDTHDRECRALCNRAACVVVAVDYRLAPEHPTPAAREDTWAALCWIASHASELGINATRIAVGGDSAGGNLAASACIRARDAGGPKIVAQLLIYPAVSSHIGSFPSHQTNAEQPFLSLKTIHWFRRHHLGSDTVVLDDPLLAPILADATDLPPALVLTAELDPLRDEGAAYAEKLHAAGVPTRHIEFAGMTHAFLHLSPVLDEGKVALEELAATLCDAFA